MSYTKDFICDHCGNPCEALFPIPVPGSASEFICEHCANKEAVMAAEMIINYNRQEGY